MHDWPIKKKGAFRKDKYVISASEYDEVEVDEVAVKKSRKIARKMPTSVSLPPEVVEELKEVAQKKGIPYQVLMRSFIIEGLDKMKKAS